MTIWIDPTTLRPRAGWRLLIQLLVMFGLLIGLSLILNVINPGGGDQTVVMFLSITCSIWITGRFFDRRPFSGFGLKVDSTFWRDYAAGWFITLIMQVFVVVQFYWAGTLPDEAFVLNAEAVSTKGFWGIFFVMLMVGFHEELWTRGYQMLNLTEGLTGTRLPARYAALFSALLTSILFGFLHAANPNATWSGIINIVMAGLWLALPYLITGRLALSIGMHSGWNFIMGAVFGLPVSGGNPEEGTTLFRMVPQGKEWLTGGAFGPEGGLSGVLAILLGTVLLLVYFRLVSQPIGLSALFNAPRSTAESSSGAT